MVSDEACEPVRYGAHDVLILVLMEYGLWLDMGGGDMGGDSGS